MNVTNAIIGLLGQFYGVISMLLSYIVLMSEGGVVWCGQTDSWVSNVLSYWLITVIC